MSTLPADSSVTGRSSASTAAPSEARLRTILDIRISSAATQGMRHSKWPQVVDSSRSARPPARRTNGYVTHDVRMERRACIMAIPMINTTPQSSERAPSASPSRRIKELEVMVADAIVETPDTTTLVLFTGNDRLEY